MPRRIREKFLRPLAQFAQSEAKSGILLMVCAVLALVLANGPLATQYQAIWQTPLKVQFGELLKIDKPLILWINDGLMAIFFVLVGLEIKRELLLGELSTFRKASLPIFAAIGGMVVPALIYRLFNGTAPDIRGWGIPMATDIAFALGILSLLGSRAPFALKVFLTAVAIVDDLGAVLVIAIFYTESIQMGYLMGGFGFFAGLLALNRFGVRTPWPYTLLGIALWVAFLKSGVHATIAGVLFAFAIPARVQLDPKAFIAEAAEALNLFKVAAKDDEQKVLSEEANTAVHELEGACERVQMPLQRIEHALHPWVSWFIVPVFALANAGVPLTGFGEAIQNPIALGVAFGLLIGKPVGIFLFSFFAVKIGIATLPSRMGWVQVAGLGVLAGIGFTMSLFIAELAFKGEAFEQKLTVAKVGILMGSLIAGALGYGILKAFGRPKQKPLSKETPKAPQPGLSQ